jgi:putative peptide zinc metalloprotease protein
MNLVVQSNVTGLWAVPRAKRFRVYLAGLRWELFVIATAIVLIWCFPLAGLVVKLLKSVILHVFLLGVMFQLQIYMRTDLYFVIVDAWRCYNLFGDSMANLVHVARRIVHPFTSATAGPNPILALPQDERWKVRLFSFFVVLGAGSACVMFFAYGLPILAGVFMRAGASLWHGIAYRQPVAFFDGLAVIAVEGSIQLMFLIVAWKQRKEKFGWLGELFRKND